MKRIVFIALFVFSVVLNLTVGATLVWHVWLAPKWDSRVSLPPDSPLTASDVEKIRQLGPRIGSDEVADLQRKILAKNSEILDLIAKNPHNPGVADEALKELMTLKWIEEKTAVERICRIMASIPPERRQRFLEFLKRKTCRGRGMGMGRGHRGRMGGPGCMWDR